MRRILKIALVSGLFLAAMAPTMAGELQVCPGNEAATVVAPDIVPSVAPGGDEDFYVGTVRVYLVEPTARWADYEGYFYEHSLLDFVIVDNVNLDDGDTHYMTDTWDATTTSFGIIFDANIMAIGAIFRAEEVAVDADPPNGRWIAARFADAAASAVPGWPGRNRTDGGFTHTVFIEEATATTCEFCSSARAALVYLDESGLYDMVTVALVQDVSVAAAVRVLSTYISATPSVFFDAGYETMVGGFVGSGLELVPHYEPLIQSAGARDVPPIDLVTAIDWLGNSTVRVHVAVGNGVEANTPPDVPSIPVGLTRFRSDDNPQFETGSADAEGNLLYYQWDWGDGEVSDWLGPHDDEATATAFHTWAANGDYDIRVKVKDPFGEETGWSEPLSVTVNCCLGRVGDANVLGGDEPTIGDISVMIDAKFISSAPGLLECLTEADINQSGGSNPTDADITIGDISTLIDYLFITGATLGLPDCL